MSELESAKYWVSWIELGSTIALFLVALGVGYEFLADRVAAPFRKRIEAARQQEVLQLQNETARLQKESTVLTRDIADANERAAKANQIAEQERLARLKLEAALAPRGLTAEQMVTLTAAARKFSGQQIDFCVYPNSTEINRIANEIGKALVDAGWTVNAFIKLGGSGRVVSGMLVELDEEAQTGPPDKRTREAAELLVSSLASDGLSISGPTAALPNKTLGMTQGNPKFSLRLTIGPK